MDPVTIALMALGGSIGMFSNGLGLSNTTKKLSKELKRVRQEKEDQLKYLDQLFNADKEKANKNADNSDKEVDLQERATSSDFNNQIEGIELAQQQNLNASNQSLMNIFNQTGNELAAMAGSGTRAGSSSMNEAIDFENELSKAQLQLQQDQSRNQIEYNLQNLFNGLETNLFKMQMQRDAALDLRQSYDEGGTEYNLYNTRRDMTTKQYDNQIDSIKSQMPSVFDSFVNVLTGGFSGANTGYSMGNNISKMLENGGVFNGYNTASERQSFSNLGAGTGPQSMSNLGATAANYYSRSANMGPVASPSNNYLRNTNNSKLVNIYIPKF